MITIEEIFMIKIFIYGNIKVCSLWRGESFALSFSLENGSMVSTNALY